MARETEYNEVDEKIFKQFLHSCLKSNKIDVNLYGEYDVKRGLRDSNGQGVLTGLTEISDVTGIKIEGGRKVPMDGKLYYQGYDVEDLVRSMLGRNFDFEEVSYLLLFGELPTKEQLENYITMKAQMQIIPSRFLRDVILKASSANVMNSLQRCIITLYTYDDRAEDISIENVLRQSIDLISKLPAIAVYSYRAYLHFRKDQTLIIRNPRPDYSTAENILYMMRADGKFTPLEAKVLDICLVLHAEHGGGNNSSFTDHVVTSSGTDTYSAIAASIASLKGPKHGGANLKVLNMFEDIKANCKDWSDEEELANYLNQILDKKVFDHAGLIYGMGHAVYTLSDPRERILKHFAKELAEDKGMMKEFQLLDTVERIAPDLINNKRMLFKAVCANVDMYSGFVYTMLGIPKELFTPLFAIARISGWCAHRMEELVNGGKIIRPAYKYVGTHREFVKMEDRGKKEEDSEEE